MSYTMPVTAASANRDSPPSTGTAGYDYANYFEVGFSHEEILLRFAQAYDGTQDQTDSARIVMTPRYARALLMLLQGTLARFEAVHQSMEHPAAAPDGSDAAAQG
jgi:hypothetical protein